MATPSITLPQSHHAYRTAGDRYRHSNGPIDPHGYCYDLSDRPLFCSSSNHRNEVIFGSADHALYAVDIFDPRKKPVTMYTKSMGHTDWVTTVAHLPSGQVISGAMDGKLCLWSCTDRRTCVDIPRESMHPIAKVVADMRFNTFIACEYGGNIEIYSLGEEEDAAAAAYARRSKLSSSSSAAAAGTAGGTAARSRRIPPPRILTGHSEPVLECSYVNGVLASGDKGGALMIWDLQRGQALHRFRAHPGAITAVHCGEQGRLFITAGTDGYVKIWDPRSEGSGLVQKIPAHVREELGGGAARGAARGAGDARRAGGARGGSGHGAVSGGGRRAPTPTAWGEGGRAGRGATPAGRGGPAGPQVTGAPVSAMAVTFSRGSNSDMNYIVTGGGSPADSRMCVIDVRRSFEPVAYWERHRNGIYSICVIGDDVVLSGDGVGALFCHHLVDAALDDESTCLKYGIGASSAGAVRGIHCLSGKVVTAAEDGKALVFDYE